MANEQARDALREGAQGGVVTVLGQGVKLCIQLTSVVILARLLSPEDFGIVAMATVFVAFGNLLRDFGMPTAALQSRTLSHQQASNMFWANSSLGVLAAIILVAFTPLIVLFYGEDRLVLVIPVLAITLALSGVQAQLQVHLARRMRFLPLIVTDVAAQLIGLAVAIVCATRGLGYWALVLQLLAAAFFLLIARWLATRWLPSPPRRGHETRGLLARGGHFGATQLLTYAASNVDTLSIGSVWGAGPLGFYNRSFELLSAPISGVLGPLTNVIVPTVNAVREQGRSVQTLLVRLQFAVGVSLVWVFAMGAAIAPYLIPLAFGPGWVKSVPIFQLLAVGGAFQTFSYVSYWAFIVYNQSKHLLYYNLVTKGISVLLVLLAVPLGVPHVAGAYSIALALSWPINLLWLKRVAGQRVAPFLSNGLRVLFAGAAGFAVVHFATPLLPPMAPLLDIIFAVGIGTAMFFLAIVLIPGGKREFRLSFGSLIQMARPKRRST